MATFIGIVLAVFFLAVLGCVVMFGAVVAFLKNIVGCSDCSNNNEGEEK